MGQLFPTSLEVMLKGIFVVYSTPLISQEPVSGSPTEACSEALSGLTERKLSLGEDAGSISLIALNPRGEFGAATTLPVFPFAAGRGEEASLYAAETGKPGFRAVTPEDIEAAKAGLAEAKKVLMSGFLRAD